MPIQNNAILRYVVILVAGIETIIWCMNLPSYYIGLFAYSLLAIIPLFILPLLCIGALVLALKARHLNLAGGLAGLAAILYFVG